MSVTPHIALVAWADRPGRFIFVADPSQRGRYIRTDRSVAMTPCSHCGAIRGEPCRGRQGYGGSTHVARRLAAGRISNRGLFEVDDVVVPEPVETMPEEWLGAAS